MRLFTLALLVLGAPAAAHEFWIEPLDYQIEADGKVEARLVNGEEFEGVNIPYLPQRFQLFVQFSGDQARPVAGRLGDSPGLQSDPLSPGLNVFSYVSSTQRVGYETFAKFLKFAEHKDFADMTARHMSRNLPLTDFGEAYTRYAKTLVGVGTAEGQDLRTGLETEIVALANPYTDDLSGGMPVQVWYQNDARGGAQVELFEKAPDGTVAITLHDADADGIALLPVKPGHAYLVDAVVLREPSDATADRHDAVWETLWASLTFLVPQ